jgi:hypothetical protein
MSPIKNYNMGPTNSPGQLIDVPVLDEENFRGWLKSMEVLLTADWLTDYVLMSPAEATVAMEDKHRTNLYKLTEREVQYTKATDDPILYACPSISRKLGISGGR